MENIYALKNVMNFCAKSDALKTKTLLHPSEVNAVTNATASILKSLYDLPEVECVYVTNFTSDEYPRGVLSFRIVSNQKTDTLRKILKELKEKQFEGIPSDIHISFEYDNDFYYSLTALNPSEVRRVELLTESTIVFDKTGRYKDIQKKMKQYDNYFYFSLHDYEPPVDQEIATQFQKQFKQS